MRVAGIYPQPIELDLGMDPDPDEPIGLGYVLGAAEAAGHQVRLLVPVEGDWGAMERELLEFQPDVVGVSAFTKHVDITRALARRLRPRLPGSFWVAGGSHPTAEPLDLLGDLDVCVVGEGEESFVELLGAVEGDGHLSEVAGISYLGDDGTPRQNPRRPRLRDLDSLPRPLREPRFHRAEALGICYPASDEVGFASSLYSRGCPFNCTFCSAPQHWGRQVVFRSADAVVEELAELRERYGVRFVSFADLTFTVNRRRTVELCEKLLSAGLDVHWMCETSVNTVDRELLELMAASGCTKICWGVETPDDQSVREVGKRQSFEQACEVLGWSEDSGMFNWAFTMIGFPWQSEADILSAAKRLPKLPAHQIRVSIATPFPGNAWSATFPELLPVPSSLFDTNHLVYRHESITPSRMKNLQRTTLRSFYQSAAYRRRMAKMAQRFTHLRTSIETFQERLEPWLERMPAPVAELAEDGARRPRAKERPAGGSPLPLLHTVNAPEQ